MSARLGTRGAPRDRMTSPPAPVPEARFTATVTRDDDAYVAQCNELDLAGEGATPEAAAASLKEALVEHLKEAEAVAPPATAANAPLELVVTERDAPGKVFVLRASGAHDAAG
jgi:hypothetical protein